MASNRSLHSVLLRYVSRGPGGAAQDQRKALPALLVARRRRHQVRPRPEHAARGGAAARHPTAGAHVVRFRRCDAAGEAPARSRGAWAALLAHAVIRRSARPEAQGRSHLRDRATIRYRANLLTALGARRPAGPRRHSGKECCFPAFPCLGGLGPWWGRTSHRRAKGPL
jgi:hypothetical protein